MRAALFTIRLFCLLPFYFCLLLWCLLDDDADALLADLDVERVAELYGDGLAVDVDFERRDVGRRRRAGRRAGRTRANRAGRRFGRRLLSDLGGGGGGGGPPPPPPPRAALGRRPAATPRR